VGTGEIKRNKQMLRDYREGKICEKCGSAFDLTVHHPNDKYLTHREKLMDEESALNGIIVLCRTCHYEEDFEKMMMFYFSAKERQYNDKMKVLEGRWKLERK